jgi:predicted secreted protein
MAVNWPMGLAIFFTTWWIVLFAVLPFGVRSQHEEADYAIGTDPGAPVAPRLWIKMFWTTIISAVLLGGIWAFMTYG